MRTSLTLLVLLLAGCGSKTKPRPLIVAVMDAEGQPVSTATVHVVEEGDARHKVDANDGRWTTTSLTAPSGDIPLVRDTEVHLEVTAPGYRPVEMIHVMTGKKQDRVEIALETFTPEPIPEDQLPVPGFGSDE